MNESQRIHYQAELWPAVCAAQGWDARDKELRRHKRAECWDAIGVPEMDDSMPWDNASTTALFTLLRHLANPNNINLVMAWDDCRANYKAFNAAKWADFHQRRAFGQNGGQRVVRNRFAGRDKGVQQPDEPLTEKEAGDRLMTMRRIANETVGRKPRRRGRPAMRDTTATREALNAAVGHVEDPEEVDMPF
jgi:hypothetical protein